MGNLVLERGIALVMVIVLFSGCQTFKEEPSEKPFAFRDSPARAIAYSPDGKYLLVLRSRSENDAVVLDAKSLTVLHVMKGTLSSQSLQADIPGSIVFSPDNRSVAIVGPDDRMSVWKVGSWQELRSFKKTAGVTGVAFLEKGKLLVTIEAKGNARIMKAQEGFDLGSFPWFSSMPIFSTREPLLSVASLPKGDWVAVGGSDGTVSIWDMKHRKERARLDQGGPVISMAFSPDGTFLATSVGGRLNKIWILKSGQSNPSEAPTTNRPWTSSTRRVTTWSTSLRLVKTISIEDRARSPFSPGSSPAGTKGRERLPSFNCPVVFSPDGRYVAMILASPNSEERFHVKVYETKTFQLLSDYAEGISALSFSPDGAVLAIGGRHEAVILLDPRTGKVLAVSRISRSSLSP